MKVCIANHPRFVRQSCKTDAEVRTYRTPFARGVMQARSFSQVGKIGEIVPNSADFCGVLNIMGNDTGTREVPQLSPGQIKKGAGITTIPLKLISDQGVCRLNIMIYRYYLSIPAYVSA